jgi:hypothetical protein
MPWIPNHKAYPLPIPGSAKYSTYRKSPFFPVLLHLKSAILFWFGSVDLLLVIFLPF